MNKPDAAFYFHLQRLEPDFRKCYLHEIANSGIRHLVLSECMIEEGMKKTPFLKELKQDAESFGLDFIDAHAPFGPWQDLNCPFPEYRRISVQRYKLAMELSAFMGVKTLAFHVGNDQRAPQVPLQEHIDQVCRELDELLPLAEELGQIICIENLWSRLSSADNLLLIKSRFPTDALGFCYDSGHAHLTAQGRNFPDSVAWIPWREIGSEPVWEEHVLEKLLPHIVNCHLHDNNGVNDDHKNIGAGTIDWERVRSLLQKAPRLQVVQGEVSVLNNQLSLKELYLAFLPFGQI